jgi:hypothetical protein
MSLLYGVRPLDEWSYLVAVSRSDSAGGKRGACTAASFDPLVALRRE